MSHVTNALLAFSIMENQQELQPLIYEATTRMFEDDGRQQWKELSHNYDAYGGSKALETPLYVAAFNYYNRPKLLEELAKIPWEFPKEVQLIVKEQEADYFHIYHLPGVEPSPDFDEWATSGSMSPR